MTRGIEDEEKMMSPMFPRLHVNDTEKGGPRAPPRNKMALYEQFSIPSQRGSSGSASMLPLPPNNGSTLAASISSNHVNGYEISVFTPFCNSPAPSHSEKSFSHSSGGVKFSGKMASQERRSMNYTDGQSLNYTRPLSPSAKCNSFQSHNFSYFQNFSLKKVGDENDYRVSSSAKHPSSCQHTKDGENQPLWNLSFSMHFQNVSEKQKKGTGIIDLKARESNWNETEEHRKMSEARQDPRERSFPVPVIKNKTSADASHSPSGKVKRTEYLKQAHPSSYQEHRSSSVDVLKGVRGTNVLLDQYCVAVQDKTVHKDKLRLESAGGICKENALKGRGESFSKFSLVGDNRSHNMIENGHKNHEKHGSLQMGNVERRDDVSEASLADSLPALDISPDDIVRVIGEKEFWKARQAIVNQQRAFTVQVFELHRLIKVQKLIAGSPDILLEDKMYLGKALLKASQAKTVPLEYDIEQPPGPSLIIKPKNSSQKPYPSTEFTDENAASKLPLPSVNNEASKGIPTQRSNYGSHSGGTLPTPIAANTRPSQWCFAPPGNQWLVPVMSPSEGLVFKPYTGPCPPTAGFIAPVYGSYAPTSLTGGDGELMHAAYGVPASHQQGIGLLPSHPPFGQTCFPSYGMPVMTISVPGSAVEQVSPFTGHQSKDNQLSAGDFNFTFPQQSSCNMSSQMSHVISRRVEKFLVLKESEVQGSTASSPPERPKGDALPLFPIEPTAQNGQTNEQRTRVIKVVPHNPRSATESAARIFQSIQEERNQYD